MTRAMPCDPAVDCHVHVFDPARFPYDPNAEYMPAAHETAPSEQLVAVLDAHGVSHAVIVTPTAGYGPDNRVTADAIARYPSRFKGIALVPSDAAEEDITKLKATGFVGVRFDLMRRGPELLTTAARRLVSVLRELDMVLDIQAEAGMFTQSVIDVIRNEAGRTVIDHMARPDPGRGTGDAGFRSFLSLSELDNVFVKMSGPFRFSHDPFPYRDADVYAEEIVRSFGCHRCVWGSDWPFVRMKHRLDYGPTRSALECWFPDLIDRRTVLWDTPCRLFGIESVG